MSNCSTFKLMNEWVHGDKTLPLFRGYMKYEDRVSKYWPEFAANGKEDVTIEQLLSHQVKLSYW